MVPQMSHAMSAGAGERGRKQLLEHALKRYHRSYRKRLRKLAKTSSRFGDLIVAHPAAAFALASNYGPCEARAEAVRLVKDGASLKRVAGALGLPAWLRALPPDAFAAPLPENIARETDADFGRRIVNEIPVEPSATAMWLQWVLEARDACDDTFALWLAGRGVFVENGPPPSIMGPLAAFAWTSRHGEGAAKAQLLRRRIWHAHTTFPAAVEEAVNWLLRLLTKECVQSDPRASNWFASERVSGFTFVPLRHEAELAAEGRRMKNCVGTYVGLVSRMESLVYAIRRGNDPVATLEVGNDPLRPGRGYIVQLEGPGNGPAPEEVWRAAEKWVSRKRGCPAILRRRAAVQIDASLWRKTWAPYLEAKGERRWLARAMSEETVAGLYRDVDQLVDLCRRI